MREWRRLSQLQELNLKGCYKIEDGGLAGISLLTSLTSINMQECWQITAQGLAALSGPTPDASSTAGSSEKPVLAAVVLAAPASQNHNH